MDSDYRELWAMMPVLSVLESMAREAAYIRADLARHNGCPTWAVSDRLAIKRLNTLERRIAIAQEKS